MIRLNNAVIAGIVASRSSQGGLVRSRDGNHSARIVVCQLELGVGETDRNAAAAREAIACAAGSGAQIVVL